MKWAEIICSNLESVKNRGAYYLNEKVGYDKFNNNLLMYYEAMITKEKR